MEKSSKDQKDMSYVSDAEEVVRVKSVKVEGATISSLQDLFLKELKDIYSAEKQLIVAFPKMVDAATSPELKDAFEDHLDITEVHVKRLDEVFSLLDLSPISRKSETMKCLIEDAEKRISEINDLTVRDAALICSMQKLEHYEIATYGCLRTYAMVLGYGEAADLLQATLDEEGTVDEKLSHIAISYVNEEANYE